MPRSCGRLAKHMTSSLTDVASKLAALKQRKDELVVTDKMVDELLRTWAPEEAPPTQGCLPKIRICPSWMSKGSRVSTKEPSATADASGLATASTVGETVVRQSGDSNHILNRLVGVRKQQTSESEKLQTAMQTVQLRVDSLSDRVKIGRERALIARQQGRQEEAVRELRKSKAIEKQLAAARMALDTLERQQDMIAETTLQRELATALKSTTAGVKAKNKGLLSLAESAIDESVEVRDDVEDVAAVFEGMVPAYDTGVDEDDLLAELNDLVGEAQAQQATSVAAAREDTAAPVAFVAPVASSGIGIDSFPSAPLTEVSTPSYTGQRKQERRALLSDDGAGAV